MTIYAVFDHAAKPAPVAVPDRFSWFAALLPPVFALARGLWLELVAYLVVVMLLAAAVPSIGGDAVGWIYLVFAVWIGFEAPALRRGALSRRRWRFRGDFVAASEDVAMLEGLRSRPAA